MSNLREAAQDALAALNGVLDTYGEPLDKLSIAGGTFEALVCRDAITALRAALAQPEPAALEDIPACMFCGELIEPAAPSEDRPLFDPEYPDSGYCTNAEWAARKSAQAAASTVVEPVLFIHPSTLKWDKGHVGAWKPGYELPGYIPLYLATPPRAALTESALIDAFCKTPDIHQFVSAFVAGARFAEQAHGIGGPRNE